jgi:hypothetical protein
LTPKARGYPWVTVFVRLFAAGALFFLTIEASASASRSAVVLSPVYAVERKWNSMQGPRSTQPLTLWEAETPELLWITGVRAEIVGEDGVTPMPLELFCHINVDWDLDIHRGLFRWSKLGRPRVISLSQGQTALRFPEGSGIPVFSDEPLTITTQVLNHNIENANLRVRHRVTVDFLRQADAGRALRPLFPTMGYVLAVVKGRDGYPGIASPSEEMHGEACLPGRTAPNAFTRVNYSDAYGREFTGHWVVPPGRETRRTNVTELLDLPFDTTLHFAAVHLHPFAGSLELRDLTKGQTVFRAQARGPDRGVGLAHVDTFSSASGVMLLKDHQYQLVSIYEKPPPGDADAMAAVFLLLHDREFQNPPAGGLVSPLCDVQSDQASVPEERDFFPR